MLIQKSVLILQFHGEFQIAAFQTLSDPLVDPAIQFRTEMILPVTRFTFLNRIWMIYRIFHSIPTFISLKRTQIFDEIHKNVVILNS